MTVDLPSDFPRRVRALRNPAAFITEVLDRLQEQEWADARYPDLQRRRQAWAALERDTARRYAEAIAEPWATTMVLLSTPPAQMREDADRLRRRIAHLNSDAPEAVARRAAARAESQRQMDEVRAAWHRSRASMRIRIEAAGLRFMPELFLPEDLPD